MAGDYLDRFSFMRRASEVVADCLRAWFRNPQGIELEGRLGLASDSRFVSDVGREAHERIAELLGEYQGWSEVRDWVETHDVYFEVKAQGGEAKRLRTEVSTEQGNICRRHIAKRAIGKIDLALQSLDASPLPFQLDARICASCEEPVEDDHVPSLVRPIIVRIKQRKTFFLKARSVDDKAFRFDLTRVWSGASYQEAEAKQASQAEPAYEMEIECTCPSAYLAAVDNDFTCLALSLLLKLRDIATALNERPVTFAALVAR